MPASKREQTDFIERFADIAIEIANQTGVRPEVVLGQTALETGWGKSVAGNNMFGIKGQGQMVQTTEDIPGLGKVGRVESFRAYDDPRASFADYKDLTLKGVALSDIVNPNMSAREQAAALKAAGYATDRDYAKILGNTAASVAKNPAFQEAVITASAALPAAPTDLFTGIGVPTPPVDMLGPVPDITPQQPASAGFSFDLTGATIPNDVYNGVMDAFAPQMDQAAFDDIFNAGFPAVADVSVPLDTAVPDFSDIPAPMGMDTFNAIQSAGFPEASISMDLPKAPDLGISPVGALGMGQSFGIEASPFSPSGFAAGTGMGPYGNVPDFSAPSLDARNAMDRFEGVMGVRNNTAPDLTNEAIAARVNAELSPVAQPQATPQLAAAPMSMDTFNSIHDLGPFSLNNTSLPSMAAAPMPAPSFSAAPSAPAPTATAAAPSIPQGDISPSSSLGRSAAVGSLAPSAQSASSPNYGGMVDSTFGMGKPQGGFMDAMVNPGIAQANYGTPQMGGFFDGLTSGWSGPGLAVGALGLAAGGLPGAIAGYQAGKYGAGLLEGLFGSNGLDGLQVSDGYGGYRAADILDAMSNPDIAGALGGGFGGFGGDFGGFGGDLGGGGISPDGHGAGGWGPDGNPYR